MKFKDILFLEQVDNWGNPIEDDDFQNDINQDLPQDQVPDQDQPNDIPEPPLPEDGEEERREQSKRLSNRQQIKQKWQQENPGVTEFQMEDALGFFELRRDGLRPFHPFGYQENGRHYINVPEVTSIAERFPNMIPVLENKSTLLDLKKYPWEVMEFWMDVVREDNALIDEENIVPGTKLPIDEQLTLAKEIWTQSTSNKIVDEGGLMAYKIESKNESIAFGSIQRILNIKRHEQGNSRGSAYWCTTVPLNDRGRSNLWTNYRPSNGFYYVWDQNKNEDHQYYSTAILAKDNDTYSLVDLYNSTTTGHDWDYIVRIFPQLEGKQQFFKWFGTTNKEKSDLTIDQISMVPGHKYYFGTIPKSWQRAYVDSGRHVKDVRAFLTMDPSIRKHYVDKTTKLNNDLQTRFVCSDTDNPFGILEILRLETKPENLYKYLDTKILKTNLGVPDGILAIKKLIIGTNWKRWLTDEKSNNTLIAASGKPITKETKFGVINLEDGEIIKDVQYRVTDTKLYLKQFDQDGVKRREFYVLQKYNFILGNSNPDPEQFFHTFTTKEAMIKKESPNYLKGGFFDGTGGEAIISREIENHGLVLLK